MTITTIVDKQWACVTKADLGAWWEAYNALHVSRKGRKSGKMGVYSLTNDARAGGVVVSEAFIKGCPAATRSRCILFAAPVGDGYVLARVMPFLSLLLKGAYCWSSFRCSSRGMHFVLF